MLIQLSHKDTGQILAFAYEQEIENIFIIANLTTKQDPFLHDHYYAWCEENTIVGIAAFFGLWGSCVVNAPDNSIIQVLVDHIVAQGHRIEFVPAFKKFAEPMIDRLLHKHSIQPKRIDHEIVHLLTEKDLVTIPGNSSEIAKAEDRDELVFLQRELTGLSGDELHKDITAQERERTRPHETWIIRAEGRIAAKANLIGVSDNYFQIGGVITRKEHRNKGHARAVVASLCTDCFATGKKFAMLFVEKNNSPAIKAYTSLGFRPIDEYLLAIY